MMSDQLTLREITSKIIDARRPFGSLGAETVVLHDLLQERAAFRLDSHRDIAEGETLTSNGLAISPTQAAMCAREVARTAAFIRGIEQAIRDTFLVEKGRPIRVLYAGCGPYALLAIPQMSLFSSEQIQFVLLDIHEAALASARTVVESLGFTHHVIRYVESDACRYQIPAEEQPDIIISETMNVGLANEPLVAIACHLLKQSSAAKRILAAGLTSVFAVCLAITTDAEAEQNAPHKLTFEIKLSVPVQQLSDEFCWFHPRAAPVPSTRESEGSAVMITLQKHLQVSDYYSGLWMMRSADLGTTWSGPTEVAELAWKRQPDGVIIAVADVTPGWHAPTGKLLAIGCTVRYGKQGQQLADTQRPSQTAYAVYEPNTASWSAWKVLRMPDDDKFSFCRNACSQWLVQSDGTLLMPVYFSRTSDEPFSVTVVRCSFDGRELKYLEHGEELSLNVVRGLCEPSITFCQERYFLTIRNDVKGYVTSSDDGLRWKPIQPWTFDDGSDLGSYNTQQHWLSHSDGLFLVYTRRGANNDHIFRHRAPLFIAQVDRDRLCVIRETEQILIPEQGAAMGNFGASAITPAESWVTVGEYMSGGQPHPRGANGSVFVARVIWSSPNKLVERK